MFLTFWTIADASRDIADHWHNQIVGQKRKYSCEPYTVHTNEVARIYSNVFPNDDIGEAIAEAHDILEDTPIGVNLFRQSLLREGFEPDFVELVVQGVIELTDIFTKNHFPNLNREQRKKLEKDRIARISIRSKNIKLADLISNSNSIVKCDKNFAKVFLKEKLNLLEVLSIGTHPKLLAQAQKQTIDGLKELGI